MHRLENLMNLCWRRGTLVGASALLIGIILRSAAVQTGESFSAGSLLSSVTAKAALVALIASLLNMGFEQREFLNGGQQPHGWAGLIPLAVVSGVSVIRWPVESSPAPLLLVCTIVAAGFGLWSAGQGLEILTDYREENQWAAAIAFAWLSANIVVAGGINWRLWGTVVAAPNAHSGILSLMAVWLISTAGLILQRRSAKLAAAMNLVSAALLVTFALSVRWILPFS